MRRLLFVGVSVCGVQSSAYGTGPTLAYLTGKKRVCGSNDNVHSLVIMRIMFW